jgi:FKBP-type peptidyl-prolyl cis-trans isomerase
MRLIFFFCLFFCVSITSLKTEEHCINNIEQFFSCLLEVSPIGHTLFGKKPLTFFRASNLNYQAFLSKIFKEDKLYNLAPYKKGGDFIFISYEDPEKAYTDFLLFNRLECLNTIKKNIALFSQAFNEEEAVIILKIIIDAPDKLLKRRDLLGILLGFGVKNSLEFEKTIYSPLEERHCKLIEIGENPCLSTQILGPVFMSFDDEETAPLKAHYEAVLDFLFYAKEHYAFHKLLIERLTSSQHTFEIKKKANISLSECFLQKIALKPSVKVVVEKKVFYEVIKEGHGEELKDLHTKVNISFNIFTPGDLPSPFSENFTRKHRAIGYHFISGIQKALLGMREGEMRRLYIHPHYAFQETWTFGPHELVIYDILLEKISPSR